MKGGGSLPDLPPVHGPVSVAQNATCSLNFAAASTAVLQLALVQHGAAQQLGERISAEKSEERCPP